MCDGPPMELQSPLEPSPESGGVSCVKEGEVAVWNNLFAAFATEPAFELSNSLINASVFEALIRGLVVSFCCAYRNISSKDVEDRQKLGI